MQASQTWWDTDWSYHKNITINNNRLDYQMNITVFKNDITESTSRRMIDTDGHCKDNFGDLRIIAENTTEVAFWIENLTFGNSCHLWFNNSGNWTNIQIFYGNSSANLDDTSYHSGSQTFWVFDDFNDYVDAEAPKSNRGWSISGGGAGDSWEADDVRGFNGSGLSMKGTSDGSGTSKHLNQDDAFTDRECSVHFKSWHDSATDPLFYNRMGLGGAGGGDYTCNLRHYDSNARLVYQFYNGGYANFTPVATLTEDSWESIEFRTFDGDFDLILNNAEYDGQSRGNNGEIDSHEFYPDYGLSDTNWIDDYFISNFTSGTNPSFSAFSSEQSVPAAGSPAEHFISSPYHLETIDISYNYANLEWIKGNYTSHDWKWFANATYGGGAGGNAIPQTQSYHRNNITVFTYHNNSQNDAVEGDYYISMYNHDNGIWSSPIMVGHNDLTDNDLHGTPASWIAQNGSIRVFHGGHSGVGETMYYNWSSNPYDISSFDMGVSIDTRCTYPQVMDLGNGSFIFFMRDYVGSNQAHYYYRKSWDFTNPVEFVDYSVGSIGCYVASPRFDGTDKIYFIIYDVNHSVGCQPRELIRLCYLNISNWKVYSYNDDDLGYQVIKSEADQYCGIYNTTGDWVGGVELELGDNGKMYLGHTLKNHSYILHYYDGSGWTNNIFVAGCDDFSDSMSIQYWNDTEVYLYPLLNETGHSGDMGGNLSEYIFDGSTVTFSKHILDESDIGQRIRILDPVSNGTEDVWFMINGKGEDLGDSTFYRQYAYGRHGFLGRKVIFTHLRWSTSNNLTNVSDGNLLYNGSLFSYNWTGLSTGTTYYVRAWHYVIGERWNWTGSNILSFSTLSGAPGVNDPPLVLNANPGNSSKSTPSQITFDIEDPEGHLMNYTVETNPNIASSSVTNVYNTSVSIPLSGLDYDTKYRWCVNLSDGFNTTREWYEFTTSVKANSSPGVLNAVPANNTNVDLLNSLRVFVYDDWTNFNYTIDCKYGNITENNVANGTKTCSLTGATNDTFIWYVNVTDNDGNSATYWFVVSVVVSTASEGVLLATETMTFSLLFLIFAGIIFVKDWLTPLFLGFGSIPLTLYYMLLDGVLIDPVFIIVLTTIIFIIAIFKGLSTRGERR